MKLTAYVSDAVYVFNISESILKMFKRISFSLLAVIQTTQSFFLLLRDSFFQRRSSGSCIATGYGGGWWYRYCAYATLNGQRKKNMGSNGMSWYPWKQTWSTVKSSMMMTRCD